MTRPSKRTRKARKARKSYSYNWDLSDGLLVICIVVSVLLWLSLFVPGGLK